MGSMSKVMEKLRGKPSPTEEELAAASEQEATEQTSVDEQPTLTDGNSTADPATDAAVDAAAPTDAVQTDQAESSEQPASGFVPEQQAVATDGDADASHVGQSDDQPDEPSETPSETATQSTDTHDPDRVAWDPQRVDPAVVAFHDRYSAICEQFRSVRARLLTMNTRNEPQVLTVTSAIPEEGKSVSTINLGLVLAEGGEHLILVADADFRRASLARMLGVPDELGFADVLRGDVPFEHALRATPFPNLKILTAGRVQDNAYGELFSSQSAANVIETMRQSFDYVLLDTPPVTTVSDVCLLAPQCDGALMVVQMRRTPEPTVQQAVRTLQANNVKVLGSILSRFRERGSGYYEHYYSSYYYR